MPNRKRTQSIFLIISIVLSLFLFIDLLFLNGILLTWMSNQLNAVYFGKANPMLSFLFKRVAIDAYKTPIGMYQDKLRNAYQEIKIPFLFMVIGLTAYFWGSTRPAGAALAIWNWFQRLSLLLLFCLLLPIASHALLGTYSRFMADDYCSAGIAHIKGVLDATIYWYLSWTGRYSANFLDSFFGFIGPRLTPFATPIALFIWFAALVFASYQFLSAHERPARFYFSTILAAAFLFSILEVSPSLEQSLYWGQGMRSLVPPLILGIICIGLLRYCYTRSQTLRSKILWGLLAGGIVFIAGGFDETFMALQVSVLAIALFAGVAFGSVGFKKKFLPQTVICFICSIASSALVYLAPGNKVRQSGLGPPSGLMVTLEIASRSALKFLEREFSSWTGILSLLALLVLAGLVASFTGSNLSKRLINWGIIGLPVTSLVLLVACFAPAAYALGRNLPTRTFIIPVFVLLCTITTWGGLLGELVRQKVSVYPAKQGPLLNNVTAAFVLILYLIVAPLDAFTVLRQVPTYSTYALVWDANDAQIQAAKSAGLYQVDLNIPQNWAGLDDIGLDPKFWINVCVDRYYGATVTGKYIRAK